MICRIYDVPGATLDQFDAVDRPLGPEIPDGAQVHIAGKIEDGFRVIEVWDSPEHIERFMDSGLAQALQEAQIPEPDHRVRGPQARLGPGLTTDLGGELRLSGAEG